MNEPKAKVLPIYVVVNESQSMEPVVGKMEFENRFSTSTLVNQQEIAGILPQMAFPELVLQANLA